MATVGSPRRDRETTTLDIVRWEMHTKKLLKIRYGQASGVEEARQNRECEGRSQRNAYSMQIAMATAAIAVATTIAIANVATADRGVAKKRPGDKNPGYSQDRDA
ncbi:uncharacterized protein LOC143218526 isoform X2 [Lasioglossum baleicum]|uniref:uncharacterized protein LOC143218526 isoform X2 n=1 Tax=Lasioglossum baleicum TaxID=434251 RepID=UPI003FCCEEAB